MDERAMKLGELLLGEMDTRAGLPRPDWRVVQHRWLSLPQEEQPMAWAAVEKVWQQTLAKEWGGGFRVVEKGEHLLTTDLPDEVARLIIKKMVEALEMIERCLTGVGLTMTPNGGAGYDVTVICSRVEDYLHYVSDVHHEEHQGAASGGMCIRQGSVHVAAHGSEVESLERVLAHELAHSRLAELVLPVWLEEGLVTHLENAVLPSDAFQTDLRTIALHRDYWTPRKIEAFFTGEGFHGRDDAHGLAYTLAYSVVGQMMQSDSQRFAKFLELATWQDQGETACLAVYDMELPDLLPGFVHEAAKKNAGLDEE